MKRRRLNSPDAAQSFTEPNPSGSQSQAPKAAPAPTPQLGQSTVLPLDNIRIDLTPAEMKQTGVVKLIVGEKYRLENEVKRLKTFEDDFHCADKERSVLKVRLEEKQESFGLATFCTTLGGLIFGAGVTAEKTKMLLIYCGIGALLIVIGYLAGVGVIPWTLKSKQS